MFIIRKVLLLVVVLVALGYGLLAAQTASPGNWLYPGKILGDQIIYNLTPGEENKLKLKLNWLGQKGIAVKKDNLANNQAQASKDANDFNSLTNQIKQDIKNLKDGGKDVTDLQQTLQATLDANPQCKS